MVVVFCFALFSQFLNFSRFNLPKFHPSNDDPRVAPYLFMNSRSRLTISIIYIHSIASVDETFLVNFITTSSYHSHSRTLQKWKKVTAISYYLLGIIFAFLTSVMVHLFCYLFVTWHTYTDTYTRVHTGSLVILYLAHMPVYFSVDYHLFPITKLSCRHCRFYINCKNN